MSGRDRAGRRPDVSIEIGHDQLEPRRARVAIRPLLEAEDSPTSEAIKLCTSELVSNVVLHATGAGTVRAWRRELHTPFRLEVEDHDLGRPHSPREASCAGGRGLQIVDQLADAWGVDMSTSGKVVWAEFGCRD